MAQKESELKSREAAIEEELKRLEDMKASIVLDRTASNAQSEERMSKLVETLENMSPKKASEVLQTVDEKLAVIAMTLGRYFFSTIRASIMSSFVIIFLKRGFIKSSYYFYLRAVHHHRFPISQRLDGIRNFFAARLQQGGFCVDIMGTVRHRHQRERLRIGKRCLSPIIPWLQEANIRACETSTRTDAYIHARTFAQIRRDCRIESALANFLQKIEGVPAIHTNDIMSLQIFERDRMIKQKVMDVFAANASLFQLFAIDLRKSSVLFHFGGGRNECDSYIMYRLFYERKKRLAHAGKSGRQTAGRKEESHTIIIPF